VGAGAGVGAAVIAYRYLDTPPLQAAAGGAVIGLGTAIGVSLLSGREKSSTKFLPPARTTTKRGSEIMTTPGSFTSTVQQALTNAGFNTGGIDNDWGSHTSAAVRAFQNTNNMASTGLPEPEMLHALGVAIPAYPGATDIASALATDLAGVVDPKDAIKVLLNESGMDPTAINHDSKGNPVAAGVFQLLVSAIPGFTGMSLEDWTALSAAQQIPYAAKFWREKTSQNGAPLPVSARDLYWLNYMPAAYTPGAPDDYQFVRSDDTWLPRGSSTWKHAAGFYTQNAGLDHPLTPGGPPKGFITAGDMALAADRGAMNKPVTYAAIADALSSQGVA
jgi:peptidoglycan hydrolase-like protein with peptidoglycan-binding domain